jgi:hypothetical protein
MEILNRLSQKIKQEGFTSLFVDSYTLAYEKFYDWKYDLDTHS